MKIFLIILLFIPVFCLAQGTAFETVTVTPALRMDISNNNFHEYWSSSTGYGLSVSTPFYFGDISLHAQFARFGKNNRRDVKSFSGYHTSLSLSYPVRLSGALELKAGVYTGLYIFVFSERKDLGEAGIVESEVSAGMNGAIIVNVGDGWLLEGGVEYLKIYTAIPIELTYLSAGISKRFSMPQWLKEILQ